MVEEEMEMVEEEMEMVEEEMEMVEEEMEMVEEEEEEEMVKEEEEEMEMVKEEEEERVGRLLQEAMVEEEMEMVEEEMEMVEEEMEMVEEEMEMVEEEEEEEMVKEEEEEMEMVKEEEEERVGRLILERYGTPTSGLRGRALSRPNLPDRLGGRDYIARHYLIPIPPPENQEGETRKKRKRAQRQCIVCAHSEIRDKVEPTFGKICGYTHWTRKDRLERAGDGVAVCFKEGLQSQLLDVVTPPEMEAMFFRVVLADRSALLICAMYRPPRQGPASLHCMTC
ncbi:hypothetical protein Pmani_021553 [Petrolisthes manimaculis]|uniref:Uncharacterized protein n=1 Tax=Petrolisthes manimaculis TaxID=1843537 RepID=A0AAE1PDP6_9EUCA|nr:hypothetical protein Pmani_021553 [Petrolisthes manimaculis]